MTCIVGLVDDGKVFIGGDSAGVADYCLTVRADEKVFVNGEFIFGFTSSFRMGQLLRYKFVPPPFFERELIEQYMNTRFVDEIRKTLKEGGYATAINGQETGGEFLVGIRGRLFCVSSDFQIGQPAGNFDAIGCAHDIAKGALFATKEITSAGSFFNPEKRLHIALEAAHQFSAAVRPPFLVLTIMNSGMPIGFAHADPKIKICNAAGEPDVARIANVISKEAHRNKKHAK